MIGLILSFSSLHITRLDKYRALHFSLLRTVEPLSAVKANHLLGCSINDKVQLYILFAFLSFSSQMRAVLVDWLVEVQLQFKLLQV